MQAFFYLDADAQRMVGILSAALSVIAYLPYMRDILRGKTHPQRASWLIWTLLSSLAFAAQYAEGATTTLWFAGAQVTGTVTVFLMSITHGKGVFLTRPDERVVWLAIIGLVVWYFTENAAYTLALTITISLLGGSLTVIKAFVRPSSETLIKWGISVVASSLAILSVGQVDWLLLAYPLYLFTLNTMIVSAILSGRVAAARSSTLPYGRHLA